MVNSVVSRGDDNNPVLALLYHRYLHNKLRWTTLAEIHASEIELKHLAAFHDTWTMQHCGTCLGRRPIQGMRYQCNVCHGVMCSHCRVHGLCCQYCSPWSMMPPARQVHEATLAMLASQGKWSDYSTRFQAYDAYCAAFHVPRTERLVRKTLGTRAAAFFHNGCFALLGCLIPLVVYSFCLCCVATILYVVVAATQSWHGFWIAAIFGGRLAPHSST
ncbi:Aste57867_14642 [Aphanomyces stellatus]|uniref:Aste57867_14642 protein n=1 Tax=Aphanomyces stellatus TaxID=120398 RepID=A0A485L206_9STRA|nr:hypothetical protein As57867_014587 [Aphanomyces stellatus]VFT91461.1 Aste57867_14642 [Aphanomyces stellatus]